MDRPHLWAALTAFFARHGTLLTALLLLPMLIPVWATTQPALGDYNNHLLQANIVLHYADPEYGYAAGHTLAPHWYLNTTALSTILLVGLGAVLPMTLAGRIVLTLYLVLFVTGLARLLDRTENRLPLLLAGPILAYNFTFTTGFINFAYGVVGGMWALLFLLRWRERGRARDLWIVGGLLVLTCLAHVLAWLLWVFALAALTSADRLPRRRYLALYAALTAGALLLGLTRPSLAAAALLIGPGLWMMGAAIRRLHLPGWVYAAGGVIVAAIAYRYSAVTRLPAPLLQSVLPEAVYSRFDKQSIPLRLLTIPHQFAPPDAGLTWLNLVLVGLVVGLVVLLTLHTWRARGRLDSAWPRTVGLLLLGFMVLPTRTYDIVFIEPRVLIVGVIVALAGVPPLGAGTRLRAAVGGVCVGLALATAVTLGYAAHRQGQEVAAWRSQLAELPPARNLLVFYEGDQSARGYANWLRRVNTVYDGRHLVNLYGVEQGGLVSLLFTNGPVQLRPEVPLPGYWLGFDNAAFVTDRCPDLRAAYGAVVAIMDPVPPDLAAALDRCFGAPLPGGPLHLWRR